MSQNLEETRKHRREYLRQWSTDHPGYWRKWRKEHPDSGAEARDRWRKNNPDKVRAMKRRRNERHREKMNQWVREHPEAIAKTRKKYKQGHLKQVSVYQRVSSGVKSGVILKPSACSECGTEKKRIEGHHFDYDKPYELTWLCHTCHMKIHRKGRTP
jgi:hypothetical protein